MLVMLNRERSYENYLLNPQLRAAELSTFAGLYPSANYMVLLQFTDSDPDAGSQYFSEQRPRSAKGRGKLESRMPVSGSSSPSYRQSKAG